MRAHHLFCILPPHLLKEIAKHGGPNQREWAWRTLVLSEQMRGRRQVDWVTVGVGT